MDNRYEKLIAKIADKVKKTAKKDDFSFVFITDLHADFESNREPVLRQCRAATELANKTTADCIIIGGDVIHGIFEKEYSLNTLKTVKDIFSGSHVPVITVHGNHDDNAYQSDRIPWQFDPSTVPYRYMITNEEFVKEITAPLAMGKDIHDKDNPFSAYYFMDFPEKKKRIVVLDGYDYPFITEGKYARYSSENWNRFSDGQLKWLSEQALDIKNKDWEIIITSHSVLDSNICGLKAENYTAALDILYDFNKRMKVENSNNRIRLCVYGHTHVDSYSYKDGLLHMVTGCCAPHYYEDLKHKTDFLESPLREPETEKEPLFDYYIVSDDKVYRYRFGSGKDIELQF